MLFDQRTNTPPLRHEFSPEVVWCAVTFPIAIALFAIALFIVNVMRWDGWQAGARW